MKRVFTAMVAGILVSFGLLPCTGALAADTAPLLTCKAGQVEVFIVYAVQGKSGQSHRNIFVCMAQEAYGTEAGIKVLESRLAEKVGKAVVVTFFARVN
jgi:hypothetical protein